MSEHDTHHQDGPLAGAPAGPAPAAPAAGGAGPDRPHDEAAGTTAINEAPSADRDAPVAALQERIADLEAYIAELEDRWRRALAETDNLRKRYERDTAVRRDRERVEVAAAWLPVVDHLELALAHAKATPASIAEGVRGIRDQALAVLADLGFPRRDDTGARFDPARHEAVAATPTHAVPAGTVLEVLRPAFGEGERQLRPAAVVVAADPSGDHRAEESGGKEQPPADRAAGRSDSGGR